MLEQLRRNPTMLLQLQTAIAVSPLTNSDHLIMDNSRHVTLQRYARDRADFRTSHRARVTAIRTQWQQQARKGRRIRLRTWFTAQVWEITYSIAQAGFDFSFRTCNFVAREALIFQACRSGSIGEVRALFQSGEASPFDCSYESQYGCRSLSVLAVGLM